jgi:hypothetical protein
VPLETINALCPNNSKINFQKNLHKFHASGLMGFQEQTANKERSVMMDKVSAMTALRNLFSCLALANLLTGCTITRCNITGTEGAAYRGYHWMCGDKNSQSESGQLPNSWFETALCLGYWEKLDECEYRKVNTNDCLILKVRTHGFKGTFTAPAGTEGLRVVREGSQYKAETF